MNKISSMQCAQYRRAQRRSTHASIALIIIAILVVLVIGAIVIGGLIVGAYNDLVSKTQSVDSSWSEVQNQYQRQADLIPNLVAIVSSSTRIETSFIQNVTESRSRWQTSQSQKDRDVAGLQMNAQVVALVNAVSTVENYPALQANKQYVTLTDEVAGSQNRITVARGRYIEEIKAYNVAVKLFPGSLVAMWFGFAPREYYAAQPAALETPKVGTGTLP